MSTKHIEALKLALEGAANYIDAFGGDSRKYRQALAEQPAQPQQELQTCNCRWDGDTQVQQCTLHEAHVDAIHEWAERAKDTEHKFKNFHRLLCERFDYTHDERNWKRDQLSLIEWIAKPAQPQQEPVAIVDANDDGYWAEILPDRNVKVGQLLYTSPPAQRKPLGFAGVTVWVGDAVATQIVTEVAIQHERVSGQSITMAAQRCVDMLAANGTKGKP